MAFSLKKWIGSMLFSTFMDEYNENMEAIEDKFGEVEGDIAGVVESGYNANGTYIKWADGTMICTGYVIATQVTSASLYKDWTYPIEFFEKPNVFITIFHPSLMGANTGTVGYYSVREWEKTYARAQITSGDTGWAANDKIHAMLMAIGRWKE